MPYNLVLRVLAFLLSCLPISLYATSPSTVIAGVTRQPDIAIPSEPISTQAQLDAYLRDTPASRSPLNWLTPAAKRRFLQRVVFGKRGLGGLDLGDLEYELTREQLTTCCVFLALKAMRWGWTRAARLVPPTTSTKRAPWKRATTIWTAWPINGIRRLKPSRRPMRNAFLLCRPMLDDAR